MASRWDTVFANEFYQFPHSMPETLLEISENTRRRPFYCYRVFINNVDNYVSREIAKFFCDERYLTPELIKSMGKPVPPTFETVDSDAPKESESKKSKKHKSLSRKSVAKRKSRASKSPPKQKSRASKSPGKSRASKSPGKSRASKSPGKSRASKTPGKRKSTASKSTAKRKSQASQKSTGKRKSQSPTQRKSMTKKSGKSRKSAAKDTQPAVPTRIASPEEVETKLVELWPKYKINESQYLSYYKWNVDYETSPDINLSKCPNAFVLETAREFRAEPFLWDDGLKQKMKSRSWLTSRFPFEDSQPSHPGKDAEGDWHDGLYVGLLPERLRDPSVLFMNKGPITYSRPIKAGNLPQQLNTTIPNVEIVIEEFRKRLWDEDRGEKSLLFYNNDLLTVDPTFRITATRTQPLLNEELPYYVKEIVPKVKTREDFAQNVFPCSIIIYDVTKSSDSIDEAKKSLDLLIEELRSYSVENRLRNQALYGIHTFILISPLLTWADTRTFAKQPQDCLREEYFQKRIPHPKYRKHWELENYVYAKAFECRDLLRIIILGVGLVYGGGDHDLVPYYQMARRNLSPIVCFGSGFNIVPLIHVEDLARLCLYVTRKFPLYSRYIIAAEKQFRTSREIMDIATTSIADTTATSVPGCFGKGFGIKSEDFHNLLLNEFKFNCTYLHDAVKYKFIHDFGSDFKKTYEQYEKQSGYRPIRIVLFGPSDNDQRKIGEGLAAHYKVPLINSFRAVKIFLKILIDLQNQVLDAATPNPPAKNWRLVEGKTELCMVKTSAPLAWHRENRLLYQRDKNLEEARQQFQAVPPRADLHRARVFDFPKPDYFETEALTSAEPDNPKLRETKELLLQLDKIKLSGADLLPALLRVDNTALIVRELLKFPSVKNYGYVLDGIPTTVEEAMMIFSRTGAVPASVRPDDTGSPGDFEYLPTHVFHVKKPCAEAFKDFITGENLASFQKEYMPHFRRMQMHRLITNNSRSAIDFFEEKINMAIYRFDSANISSSDIINKIITLIDHHIDDDLLFRPDKEVYVNPNDPEVIKASLNVYSEDDGFWNGRKQYEERKKSFSENNFLTQVDDGIPLSQKVFTKEEIDEAEEVGIRLVNEASLLPDKALNYVNYLTKFVAKSIVRGAINAAEENPQDILDGTAYHLMKNNVEGGKMPLEKLLPPEIPPNLSAYPFNVDKFSRELVAHLE